MIGSAGDIKADTAVILGSGLSLEGGSFPLERIAGYEELEDLSVPTVEGHPGTVALFGRGEGSGIILFMGRAHLYEGIGFYRAGGTVRAAARLGCRRVLITNAAGCLRPDIPLGSWLAPASVASFPFRRRAWQGGRECGYRFGRGNYISAGFRDLVVRSAARAGMNLFPGVLLWNSGPCYETPAEARAGRVIGADAVTMSVYPELEAAGEFGMEVAVISCLTNYTPNISSDGSGHRGVIDRCRAARSALAGLIGHMS
ncbi:MAG: hypothetical protein GF417_11485 [Candidatus Latescibacteria bacterium]|nr:hypothetical protein [bacterium]MBD3425046.1 hypothetical protein [Candidatus Latescibacterota bacterium]